MLSAFFIHRPKFALVIAIVMTLAGGYSKDAWRSQYVSLKGIIEAVGSGSL